MIKSVNPRKILITECSKHSVIASDHYLVFLSQPTVVLLEQTLYLSHLLLCSQCLPTLSILKKCLLGSVITPFLSDSALILQNTCWVLGIFIRIISPDSCKLLLA